MAGYLDEVLSPEKVQGQGEGRRPQKGVGGAKRWGALACNRRGYNTEF